MSGGEIELVLVLFLLSSVHCCRKVFARYGKGAGAVSC